MNVFFEPGKCATVVTIEGHFVVPDSDNFKDFLLKKIEGGTTEFVLDLAKVSFIDSSGVSVLLSLLQAVRKRGGDIRLTGLNDLVAETIKQIGLHHIFRSYDSVAEGIDSFQNAG